MVALNFLGFFSALAFLALFLQYVMKLAKTREGYEIKCIDLQSAVLDKVALEKGYDLHKIALMNTYEEKSKGIFRKKLEKELVKKFFDEKQPSK